jgi:hypothetical protein
LLSNDSIREKQAAPEFFGLIHWLPPDVRWLMLPRSAGEVDMSDVLLLGWFSGAVISERRIDFPYRKRYRGEGNGAEDYIQGI